MFLGGGGAQGGYRIRDAGLVQAHHVHIAFDDHQPGKIRPRLPRFVQPVEFASLVKQGRLRGIEVFRLPLIDDPAPKPQHAPARITDRKHQAVPETVVKSGGPFATPRIAFDDEAKLQNPAPLVFPRPEPGEQGIPGIRRIAESETRGGFRVDSARPYVPARALVVRQILLEKTRSPRHEILQVGASLIARLQRLAWHFEPRALRQVPDGIEEFHLFVLHQEAQHGAVRAAAKAVVELLDRADPEGG